MVLRHGREEVGLVVNAAGDVVALENGRRDVRDGKRSQTAAACGRRGRLPEGDGPAARQGPCRKPLRVVLPARRPGPTANWKHPRPSPPGSPGTPTYHSPCTPTNGRAGQEKDAGPTERHSGGMAGQWERCETKSRPVASADQEHSTSYAIESIRGERRRHRAPFPQHGKPLLDAKDYNHSPLHRIRSQPCR